MISYIFSFLNYCLDLHIRFELAKTGFLRSLSFNLRYSEMTIPLRPGFALFGQLMAKAPGFQEVAQAMRRRWSFLAPDLFFLEVACFLKW